MSGHATSHCAAHKDGVKWHQALTPGWFHRCYAQSMYPADHIERCSCGAIRFTEDGKSKKWMERNAARKMWLRRREWRKALTGAA